VAGLRLGGSLHKHLVRRLIEFRKVRVRLTRVQPVLDIDRMRRLRGSSAALTAPGWLWQAKRSE
jgi:hypothetical protein